VPACSEASQQCWRVRGARGAHRAAAARQPL